MFIAVNLNNLSYDSKYKPYTGRSLAEDSTVHILDTDDLSVESITVKELLPLIRDGKIRVKNIYYIKGNLSAYTYNAYKEDTHDFYCMYDSLVVRNKLNGFSFELSNGKVLVFKLCIKNKKLYLKVSESGNSSLILELFSFFFTPSDKNNVHVIVEYLFKKGDYYIVRCRAVFSSISMSAEYTFTLILDSDFNLVHISKQPNVLDTHLGIVTDIKSAVGAKYELIKGTLKY